jgi:hypothetical protein
MLDLSGVWSGTYRFPRLRPPVNFSANLDHAGEWLTGGIEERVSRGQTQQTLSATIMGRCAGSEVTFMKTYDHPVGGFDAVSYSGAVDALGLEISGVWSIHGNWSGTFTMVRTRGPDAAVERKVAETV